MTTFPLWIFFSYLCGATPTAYLMGKFLKGIDIRQHGSGNPGATNVFRVVGKTAGIFTLLIDGLKGFLPVFFALRAFPENLIFVIGIGLAAILGHNWTIFLKFQGGKGVATSCGVFLGLLPIPTLISLVFFSLGLILTRHVSLGSMLGASSLVLSSWILDYAKILTFFSFFCALLIFYLHKKNIQRIIQGQEPKIPLFNDKFKS